KQDVQDKQSRESTECNVTPICEKLWHHPRYIDIFPIERSITRVAPGFWETTRPSLWRGGVCIYRILLAGVLSGGGVTKSVSCGAGARKRSIPLRHSPHKSLKHFKFGLTSRPADP